MKFSVVVFDFDGVLFDSFDIVYRINREMIPGLTREEFRQWFDGNPLDLIDRTHQTYSHEEFFERYNAAVQQHTLSHDAISVLQQLKDAVGLAIISSSYTWLIEGMLERSGISFVRQVLGGDVAHSKVEKLQRVCEVFGAESSQLLFITDTIGDVKEANDARVPTLVYRGPEAFHSGRPFEGVDVLGYIDSLAEVLAFVS